VTAGPERRRAASQGKQAYLQDKLELMSLFCPVFSCFKKTLLPLGLPQHKKTCQCRAPKLQWAVLRMGILLIRNPGVTYREMHLVGFGFSQLSSAENWSSSGPFIYKYHEERLSVFSELFSTRKFNAPYWIFFLSSFFLSSLVWKCW